MLGCATADGNQLVIGKRLLDVVVRTLVDGLNRTLQRRLCRHQNDGQFGVQFTCRLEHVDTRHLRHPDVRQDDIRQG